MTTTTKTEQTIEEMWSALSINQKVEVLREMGNTPDRQQFFSTLSPEEQNTIAEYITARGKEKKDKAYNECKQMMDILSACDLDTMLMSSIILDIYENRMKKKMEFQQITKIPKFKFTLTKFVKGLDKEIAKLRPWCKKKEKGIMTQLMTSAIPAFSNEYDNTGMFFTQIDGYYPKLMQKHTDKLYISYRKYANRFAEEHTDIGACALLIETLCQALINKIDLASNKIKEIRNEDELKRQWRECCTEAKKLGVQAPKWKPMYYPTHDIIDEIAFCCEKIATGILTEKSLDKSNTGTLKKTYGEYRKILEDFDYASETLDKCIMECITSYSWYYFSRMVEIVKTGAEMPNAVKEDINFLFRSRTGYCRMMKDIRKLANLVTSDDRDEYQDELEDLAEEHHLTTFKDAVSRVKRMKTDDNICDEKYLRNIYQKSLKKAIDETKRKLCQ